MSQEQPDFDVGIIGGGPAGGALAAYLAKAGKKVVVFERELFPRPHVGESLVPSSTRVFKDLDFLPIMEREKFPHKFGAVWTATGSNQAYEHGWEGLEADCVADIRFEERQQAGVDQNYTYHVDRGRFDNLLLHHAQSLGATVVEGVGIRDVDFSGEFPRLKFMVGPKESSVTCRIVADASGRKTFLGNRLKLKVMDKVFDQYAIHTWFDNYDRLSTMKGEQTKGDYIYVHFLPITNSWVWQIPITDTITSIGVVTQKKNFKAAADREAFFWECVASRPELHAALKTAEQVRPFSEEGDYSYAMNQITGDNWIMVGDAGRFVDPIFSTGVSIAQQQRPVRHQGYFEGAGDGELQEGSLRRVRGDPPPRHQELVQLHLGLLPAERALHRVHPRSALPARRAQAAPGRCIRGTGAAGPDQDAGDRVDGGEHAEPRLAQTAGRPDPQRLQSDVLRT